MHFLWLGIRRSNIRLAFLSAVYAAFLTVGASVFSAIQKPEEDQIVKSLRKAREKFLDNHSCVSGRHNDRPPPPRYTEVAERKPLLPSLPQVKSVGEDEEADVKQVIRLRRSTFLLLLYILFYSVYLVMGGLVFAILEGPGEEEVKQSLIRARSQFLEEHPCVEDQALEDLIEKIISASNRGVSAVGNVSGEPNWNFGQSLFFSSTVVTTIGYGHVTPLSKAGKCFCIVYAVLGIPLTLMLLTALVERLMVPSTRFLCFLNAKLGHRYEPFNIRLLHLCIIGLLLFTFFWFIPAGIFAYLEPDWDFLDSMYYCFISLTTIGLGDYIPGDSPDQAHRPLYKILTTGYLLAGLTFLVFTLTVFHEIPQLNFGVFFLMKSDEVSPSTSDPEKVRIHSQGFIGAKYTECPRGRQEKHRAEEVKIDGRAT